MNTDDLRDLFAAAVAGDTGAAAAFADRLTECWPGLLARWQANTRQAWDEYHLDLWAWERGPRQAPPPREPRHNGVMLCLEVEAGTEPRGRVAFLLSPPDPAQSDGAWVHISLWHEPYAGEHSSLVLCLPPPDRWRPDHYAALADYLIELARMSSQTDPLTPKGS